MAINLNNLNLSLKYQNNVFLILSRG